MMTDVWNVFVCLVELVFIFSYPPFVAIVFVMCGVASIEKCFQFESGKISYVFNLAAETRYSQSDDVRTNCCRARSSEVSNPSGIGALSMFCNLRARSISM